MCGLFFGQNDREHTVLHAVVGEDVGERRGDDSPVTIVRKRPDSVLARGAAAKILSRNQNAGSGIAWLVQDKTGIGIARGRTSPVVEQKFSETSLLDALQELLGDDLVGVNVGTIEWSYSAGMFAEWLHVRLPQGLKPGPD